ncbi:type II secretion system F family protein [Aneurinibacillus terranovensis]|uniref:type II secretion system F family protein n=1 Tax=Aneurinibacillus terranovensis TaxID=278991 RepID=UPI00041FC716|nr:type II secretion system F family protein [Aneurinibacillus terranovensis]
MPTFAYEARESGGKKKRGSIEANTKAAALSELKKQGVFVFAIKEVKKGVLQQEITFGSPVKNQDFVVFIRQLATLIRSGIGIVDSIHILSQQSESKALRKTLGEVEADIRQGIQLSEACAKYPKIFKPLFLNMVRAGEASGNMEIVLDRLAVFFEKSHYTREKIKSAMTYPIVMLVLSVAVTIFLLTNIVPTFVGMFKGLNAQLPKITVLTLSLSNSIVHTWYLYLLSLIILVAGFRIFVTTSRGRSIVDYGKLKMPIFGKLIQKGALARMNRTLSTLFASSVPILQALTIVEGVVDNKIISNAISEAKESLRNGRRLSEPLKKSWVFPPLVTHMIAIGEETGSLDLMLEKIADFYEAEVENMVDKVKSLIEPLMIVFLSVIIGTIVSSIMIPMFDMYSHIHQ